MFKILTIGTVLIAVMIGAVLAYASTLPDRFQVQRSLSIRASTDKMVGNDFDSGLAGLKTLAERS